MDFKKAIDFLTPQGLKDIIINLQNRIRELMNDNSRLHAENEAKAKKVEELENRIRQLLGEKSKPHFNADKNKDRTSDQPKDKSLKSKTPRRKKEDIEIDKTQFIPVPTELLDSSFEYKGTRKVVIQEITFDRENICFEVERFYSSEQGKVVEGQLPPEYQGYQYGPRLRAFVIHLFYHGDCTHNKIRLILKGIGIKICNQTINNILLETYSDLEEELEANATQAIEKYGYQHIDDTGAKVLKSGSSCYSFVCSNPEFTFLFTTDSKARSAAVDALTRKKYRLYKLNERAFELMVGTEGNFKMRSLLKGHIGEKLYDENEIEKFISGLSLGFSQQRDLKTSMHIGAMAEGHLGVVGKTLISDDAQNFKNIFLSHVLCWVHELRHYKLLPFLYEEHEILLEKFLALAWSTVALMERYQKEQSEILLEKILSRIDKLFIRPSGWVVLDEQKKLTAEKLERLLRPLYVHNAPLNNNLAERDIRGRVVKRKISLFNQTWKGARAWDFWGSLKETCRKLGINFWIYIYDRVSCKFEIPTLTAVSMS
jgi:Transposase IS66 family